MVAWLQFNHAVLDVQIHDLPRLIFESARPLLALMGLWNTICPRMPRIVDIVLERESQHFLSCGAGRPVIAQTMDELFGQNEAARCGQGNRMFGVCVSAQIRLEDIRRVLKHIAEFAGWTLGCELRDRFSSELSGIVTMARNQPSTEI